MEQQDLPARPFTREEVGEVIELATRLEQGRRGDDPAMSYEDLRSIAAELGISDESLLRAVASRMDDTKETESRRLAESQRAAKWRQAVRAWKLHLGVYLSTMAGLSVIDLASGDGIDWVFYPAAAWGIAVAIHGAATWSERPAASAGGTP